MNMLIGVGQFPGDPKLPLVGHEFCYRDPEDTVMDVVVEAACPDPIRGRYVSTSKPRPSPDSLTLPSFIYGQYWRIAEIQVRQRWKYFN